jgi:hypothetical protein
VLFGDQFWQVTNQASFRSKNLYKIWTRLLDVSRGTSFLSFSLSDQFSDWLALLRLELVLHHNISSKKFVVNEKFEICQDS